jgi:hypothetical protein
MADVQALLESDRFIDHSVLLLESHLRLVGRPLLGVAGSASERARALYFAPFVVLSHGTEADPIFNYGNALWDAGCHRSKPRCKRETVPTSRWSSGSGSLSRYPCRCAACRLARRLSRPNRGLGGVSPLRVPEIGGVIVNVELLARRWRSCASSASWATGLSVAKRRRDFTRRLRPRSAIELA